MKVKRIFILGDIHIGVRSSTIEWQNITESYFSDFFIPLLIKHAQPGDILVQLGDVFDNRQSINIKVQHLAIKYFEIMASILPTYIIAGNHDCYNKNSNDVSSLDCLKFIPNLHIYKQPHLEDFGKAKCLFLPWCSTPAQEAEILSKYEKKADYVFSHSEMKGLMLNRKSKQEHGNDIKNFDPFKRVYSGHIHYSQQSKNVMMVGNAYQMTRSDCDNTKGVYILDLTTGNHEFIENTFSPKFVKLKLTEIYDTPIGKIKDMMRNNFVDLYIPSDVPIKYNLSGFMSQVQHEVRRIEPNIYDEKTYIDIDNITEEVQNGYKNFNVINLCNKFVEGMGIDSEIKEKLNSSLSKLYTDCTDKYKAE
jgi:DNA repair exonuclease SbcCD nuclease subunit